MSGTTSPVDSLFRDTPPPLQGKHSDRNADLTAEDIRELSQRTPYRVIDDSDQSSSSISQQTMVDWLMVIHSHGRSGSQETMENLVALSASIPQVGEVPDAVLQVIEAVKEIGKTGMYNPALRGLTERALASFNVQVGSPQNKDGR